MSHKTLDARGNWREVTVCFTMSPQEAEQLNRIVALSGMPKCRYLANKLLDRSVVVQGNPKVYIALKRELNSVYEELCRIEAGAKVDPYLLDIIAVIGEIMNGMQYESDWKPIEHNEENTDK